jgi:hypothetical protein
MDWTIATDDMLTERTKTYTLCGCRATGSRGKDAWWGVLEAHGLSVGVLLCSPCSRLTDVLEQVQVLLDRRYQPRRHESFATTTGLPP